MRLGIKNLMVNPTHMAVEGLGAPSDLTGGTGLGDSLKEQVSAQVDDQRKKKNQEMMQQKFGAGSSAAANDLLNPKFE